MKLFKYIYFYFNKKKNFKKSFNKLLLITMKVQKKNFFSATHFCYIVVRYITDFKAISNFQQIYFLNLNEGFLILAQSVLMFRIIVKYSKLIKFNLNT